MSHTVKLGQKWSLSYLMDLWGTNASDEDAEKLSRRVVEIFNSKVLDYGYCWIPETGEIVVNDDEDGRYLDFTELEDLLDESINDAWNQEIEDEG